MSIGLATRWVRQSLIQIAALIQLQRRAKGQTALPQAVPLDLLDGLLYGILAQGLCYDGAEY